MAIFDNSASGQVSSGNSTLTYAFTCSGMNRLLTVFVDYLANDRTITGVTYNGVAMTAVYNQSYNSARVHGYFYLANPASGSNNIVITLSGSGTQPIVSQALSYTGVAQSGTIMDVKNLNTTTGVSVSSRTVSVTTTIDNDWIVGYCFTGGTISAGANTTMRGSIAGLLEEIQGYDTNAAQTPAGSHSVTVNISPNNTELAMYIAAFAPFVTSTNGNFLAFM